MAADIQSISRQDKRRMLCEAMDDVRLSFL